MGKKLYKKILPLFIGLVIVLISLTACGISNRTKLKAPEISFDSELKIIYWDCIEGASKYEVSVNNNLYHVTTSFYETNTLTQGSYDVFVRALGDNEKTYSSNFSTCLTLTVEENGEQTSTKNLKIKKPTIYERDDEYYQSIINEATHYAVKRNVLIINSEENAQGSGVIYKSFKQANGKYLNYVLTNNHVTYKDNIFPIPSFFDNKNYRLQDCYGEVFNATLAYADTNYDLALLIFESQKEMPTLKFAKSNPSINDKVIAIGNPSSQRNAITFGEVTDYVAVNMENIDKKESNVEFDVISHSAPIEGGSSGGVLINYQFEIVGINFAAQTNSTTNAWVSSYAIPLQKVQEFIEKATKQN